MVNEGMFRTNVRREGEGEDEEYISIKLEHEQKNTVLVGGWDDPFSINYRR